MATNRPSSSSGSLRLPSSAIIKLVLLGDSQQGRAIGVSGSYASIEREYGSVSLTDIQRAKAEWEKDLQVKFHDTACRRKSRQMLELRPLFRSTKSMIALTTSLSGT